MEFLKGGRTHHLVESLSHVVAHALITLLAVALAFSLPVLADFIQRLWPRLEADTHKMLVAEIGLASALVLLFNLAKVMWDNRARVASAQAAGLVHARHGGGILARWRERRLIRRIPAARDALMLTMTGYETLVNSSAVLRGVLGTAYEVRVMLLNPLGTHIHEHATSFAGHDVSVASLASEIEASIAALMALRRQGKKVTLKFYDHAPLWKIVILGDHAWVQHCHSGCSVREQPEYVFAFQHHEPRCGLYVPFYSHFLALWNQPGHPEYDFDTSEIVRRNADGTDATRLAFRPGGAWNGAEGATAPSQGRGVHAGGR